MRVRDISLTLSDRIRRTALRISAVLLAAGSILVHASGKEISVFKMGGNVEVDHAPDGASLTTMGGNIRLTNVGRVASLKTYGGDIKVEAATGSVTAKTMAGNITVHMRNEPTDGAGGRTIDLSSNSGEISLYLPPDFGATVEISLAYTDNQDTTYKINDDLGLQQTRSPDWDKLHGTPRKYLQANGQIGDGRNRIIIHTINGNINVHRTADAPQ